MSDVPHNYRQVEALVLEHHVRVRAFVWSLGVDRDWTTSPRKR